MRLSIVQILAWVSQLESVSGISVHALSRPLSCGDFVLLGRVLIENSNA